ncbi:hypothetical protein Bpro_0968 [Polaromonas sp. JS666]|nr:hypothetical protein Bpro_0968 [Polaromonas sp. JS666]
MAKLKAQTKANTCAFRLSKSGSQFERRHDRAKEGERLLAEAAKWQHAREIREYVAEILRLAGHSPASALAEWAKWVLQVAATEDPIQAKLASLGPGTNG